MMPWGRAAAQSRDAAWSCFPPRPHPADLVWYLEVLQHGALLCKEQRAIRALEDADTLVEQMLVKVRGEQGLVGEHRVTHGTLIDHPVGSKES